MEQPTNFPELWAGFECSVNRLGDKYLSQLETSGHERRLSDLDRVASLGVRTIRYPLIWELHQSLSTQVIDWTWAGERLSRLKHLGITPIAGFMHHGSGPKFATLVDDNFPGALAQYAKCVARQFPHLRYFTPVNEPLTTARFCCLYGLWYPHKENDSLFVRALLNQCRAIVMAMAAVRKLIPEAQLVQTEDLGKTFSTELLAYQAEFENQRRWLTFDVLSGALDRDHPLWSYLLWAGAKEHELYYFLENPCPPNILGIDHYVTGVRYLDEKLERYPADTHGKNPFEHYADVDAARVCDPIPVTAETLFREVWERYHIPFAITEVQLAHPHWQERARWFSRIWSAVVKLKNDGVDIRAVTVWSVIGAYDWDSLLTRESNSYEAGVFETVNGELCDTPLVDFFRSYASGHPPHYPELQRPGWWESEGRLLYPPSTPFQTRVQQNPDSMQAVAKSEQPIEPLGQW